MRPTVFSIENLSRALSRAADASFEANCGSCMIRPTAKANAARIGGRNQKSVLTVGDNFIDSAAPRRDDRRSGQHCLDNDAPERLRSHRAMDDDIHRLQQRRSRRIGNPRKWTRPCKPGSSAARCNSSRYARSSSVKSASPTTGKMHPWQRAQGLKGDVLSFPASQASKNSEDQPIGKAKFCAQGCLREVWPDARNSPVRSHCKRLPQRGLPACRLERLCRRFGIGDDQPGPVAQRTAAASGSSG